MVEFELSFNPSLIRRVLLLGFLLLVAGLELQLTLSNPIAFGDEGFHVSAARYYGTAVDYSMETPLYGSDIEREKNARPPLWNLMEGSFYFIFGFNDSIVKFLFPFISFTTGIVVFIFVSRLYSENVGLIASIITVTIPSYVTYSLLFYTTVPYVLLFSIGFLSLLTAIKTGMKKYWLLAGLFSGLALLANIAGLFMAIISVTMGVIHVVSKRNLAVFKSALKTYGLVLLIMFLVASPWIARNVALYAEPGCTNPYTLMTGACVAQQSYDTETENEFAGRTGAGGTEESFLNFGIVNYLQFAYGFSSPNQLLNIIGIAFVPFAAIAGLVVVAKRRKMEDIALVASVLVFLAIFYQVGLNGRAEDTSRYFLSAVPLIGILAATYWAGIRRVGKRFDVIIVASVLLVVITFSFVNFYGKLVGIDAVKDFSPNFFQACDWIKQNTPKDSNILSLHTYPTRYNCERPAVWEVKDKADILLSNDVELVKSRLKAHGIDYVFVQKFSMNPVAFGQSYPTSFVKLLENNNQTFTRVYENGMPIGQCLDIGACDGTVVYRVEA